MRLVHAQSAGPSHRRPGSPEPARKQKGGRPFGLNHLAIAPASSAMERQADEAASRIVRGDRNVARSLGPTAPASVAVPSTGASLGPHERTRLENGFGADLRAVRVHRDEHAAVAARAEHAHAFTAGRDIYFNREQYAPEYGDGFRLLAHEVAHVIQQTARTREEHDHRPRARATDAEGRGASAVQRDDAGTRRRS